MEEMPASNIVVVNIGSLILEGCLWVLCWFVDHLRGTVEAERSS